MGNTELNNISMDSIEDLMAVNILDNIIVNRVNTIRKNKKRPDETSIYKYLSKNLENTNVTKITIDQLLCQKTTALQIS